LGPQLNQLQAKEATHTIFAQTLEASFYLALGGHFFSASQTTRDN
jgi:hypothetical protein